MFAVGICITASVWVIGERCEKCLLNAIPGDKMIKILTEGIGIRFTAARQHGQNYNVLWLLKKSVQNMHIMNNNN